MIVCLSLVQVIGINQQLGRLILFIVFQQYQSQSRLALRPQDKGQFKIPLEDEQLKERKVNNVIYGSIYHDELVWKFVDTPQIQRLRKLNKLECLEYVYPSVTNFRFEYSVGSAYLTKLFIMKLIKNNPDSYKGEIQKSVIRTVALAALLYCIGYAPFNHVFQSQIMTKVQKDCRWTKQNHEIASIAIFDDNLSKKLQLKASLSPAEKDRIKNIIRGNVQNPREWQFDLINNNKNGFDVKKLQGYRQDRCILPRLTFTRTNEF